MLLSKQCSAFIFYLMFLNFVYAKQISLDTVDIDNSLPNSLKTVYPQILIITDGKFRSIFSDESEVSKYIVSYWKSVNETFSQLINPEVKLHISGIVQMDDLAKHNAFLKERRKNLLEHVNPLNLEFDVAVIMSGKDTVDTLLPGALGFSADGFACDFPNNLAVISDDGQYRTIYLAAHELAHTFSAQHDNDFDSTAKCYVDDKNIMSIFFYETDFKEFSICSKDKMRKFFNSKDALCLHNVPVLE